MQGGQAAVHATTTASDTAALGAWQPVRTLEAHPSVIKAMATAPHPEAGTNHRLLFSGGGMALLCAWWLEPSRLQANGHLVHGQPNATLLTRISVPR